MYANKTLQGEIGKLVDLLNDLDNTNDFDNAPVVDPVFMDEIKIHYTRLLASCVGTLISGLEVDRQILLTKCKKNPTLENLTEMADVLPVIDNEIKHWYDLSTSLFNTPDYEVFKRLIG